MSDERKVIDENLEDDEMYLDFQISRRCEVVDLQDKAVKTLYIKSYMSYLESQLADGAFTESRDPLYKSLQDIYAKNLSLQQKKRSFEYYFVTVSPKENDLPWLMKKTEKMANKKSTIGAMYTYELRSDGTPHVHMLVRQLQYSSTDFCRNTRNTFKDRQCMVDIKGVYESWIPDKVDYIRGDKWDPEKDEMIQKDREWRKQMKLQSYYIVGELPKEILESSGDN